MKELTDVLERIALELEISNRLKLWEAARVMMVDRDAAADRTAVADDFDIATDQLSAALKRRQDLAQTTPS